MPATNQGRRAPIKTASHAVAELLRLHRLCHSKACRRARQCRGETPPCFEQFWPLVPERTKDRVRAILTEVARGGSAAAIDAAGERAVARYDQANAVAEKHAVRAPALPAQPLPVAPVAPSPRAPGPRLRVL